MLALLRQRLSLVFGCIFISIFTFTLMAETQKDNSIPTISLPVSEKIIVIDAGHGLPDERCKKQ